MEVNNVRQCKEECNRSLLGKIWGSKTTNYFGPKSTFNQIWGQNEDIKVVELNHNFFLFIFHNNEEKAKVPQRRPWSFDNQLIVL